MEVGRNECPACIVPPDGHPLRNLVEVIECVASVLKIDGRVDQSVEVLRVSLPQHFRRVEAVTEVILAAFPAVLSDAVEPRRLRTQIVVVKADILMYLLTVKGWYRPVALRSTRK